METCCFGIKCIKAAPNTAFLSQLIPPSSLPQNVSYAQVDSFSAAVNPNNGQDHFTQQKNEMMTGTRWLTELLLHSSFIQQILTEETT